MQIKFALIVLAATASLVVADNYNNNQNNQNNQTNQQQNVQNNQNNQQDPFANVPFCVLVCANQTATSREIGCSGGVNDIGCICPKQQFIPNTFDCIRKSDDNQCKDLTRNQNQMNQQDTQIFDNMCKNVQNNQQGGGGGNSNNNGTNNQQNQQNQQQNQQNQYNQNTQQNQQQNQGYSNNNDNYNSASIGSMKNFATGTIVLSTLLVGIATLV